MQCMTDRFADRVVVPDVVGMPFHIGRSVATAAGVTLANPDPDGPPISGLAWPGLFYITSQSPVAGTQIYRWDSVVIEIVEHGPAESGALRADSPRPPADTAYAVPEHDQYVDLTENEDKP